MSHRMIVEHMKIFVAAAAFSLVGAGAATASTLTLGEDDSGNCYPFACFAQDGGTVFQQFYRAGAFPGLLTIDSTTFYRAHEGDMDDATFDISFYYSAVPFGFSSTTLAANLDAFLADWGTFAFSGAMPETTTLTGPAFTYDPSIGDLLMQVSVNTVNEVLFYTQGFFKSDNTKTDVIRSFHNRDFPDANDDGALRTTFGITPVPLPAAAWLFGSALLGLGAVKRKEA